MAKKFHVNPETGRTGRCGAKIKCQFGDDTPHFEKEWQAMKYFEEQQEGAMPKTVSKRKASLKTAPAPEKAEAAQDVPKKPGISLREQMARATVTIERRKREEAAKKEESAARKKAMDEAAATGREIKRAEAVIALEKLDPPHTWTLQHNGRGDAMVVHSTKGTRLEDVEQQLVKAGVLKRANGRLTEGDAVKDTTSLRRAGRKLMKTYAPEVAQKKPLTMAEAKAKIKNIVSTSPGRKISTDTYYSLNAGKLNPTRLEGTGAQYVEKGDSFVVLAKADGTGTRVLKSSFDFLTDPNAELGRPVTQVKQNTSISGGPDNRTYDLHVVGYTSSQGDHYGYIPDKQVSFFVFK